MRKLFVAAVAAALLAGCASAGSDYDPATAALIRPGMSKAEVIAMLGEPNSVATEADGRQSMIWSHAEANNLIGSMKTRAVGFVFDANGRVVSSISSQTTGKAGL